MVITLGFLAALFAGGLICLLLFALHLRRQVARKQEAMEQILSMREQDLDKLKKAHAMLEAASKVDGSTGIPNRAGFEEALRREWRRGLRNQTPLALALIDVDAFAEYNDTLGHLGGDDLLRRVAGALNASLMRPFDVLARFAGAGFVCLLPETDEAGGKVMAERLLAVVADLHLPHPVSPSGPDVSISLGVTSQIPHPDAIMDVLLDKAHEALKRARKAGPGSIMVEPASESPA